MDGICLLDTGILLPHLIPDIHLWMGSLEIRHQLLHDIIFFHGIHHQLLLRLGRQLWVILITQAFQPSLTVFQKYQEHLLAYCTEFPDAIADI